jgi:N-sulfoglucosamine sulfohydrolase
LNGDLRPNVIQICCHDLGRHLGCYGVETVHTPNIDSLAASGARFENSFCSAPQCSPSRAALATGRYPHQNGVMGLAHGAFGWDLGPEERPIANLMREHGHQTHLFGLQHVTNEIERLGFDHVHGRGVARDVAAKVEAFLGNPGSAADGPFYAEINLFEPHRPYDHGGVEPDDSKGASIPPYLPQDGHSREEMAELQGAVREADRAVGRVLEALEGAGLSRNTLVLFTADHGIAMPRAKCTLYDAGIEVPLIVRWPGVIGEGRRYTELVSNVDILPTLLESVGAPIPENVQGRSLLPLLRGESYEPREAAFAEKTFHSYYDPRRCVRTRRFKLIRNFDASFQVEVPSDIQRGPIFRNHTELYSANPAPTVELYDLRADPLEERNLAGEKDLSEVERDLTSRLRSWMEETGDPLLDGPVPSPRYRQAVEWRDEPG